MAGVRGERISGIKTAHEKTSLWTQREEREGGWDALGGWDWHRNTLCT